MTQELENQILVVAGERKAYDKVCAAKKISYQDWQDANSILLSGLLETEQKVKDAEALLRELTLKAFAETGNKAPAVGVGVREVTTYSYDNVEALAWAKEHGLCLKLDDNAFKKQVKISPLPFVTSSTEAQATISQDLRLRNEVRDGI